MVSPRLQVLLVVKLWSCHPLGMTHTPETRIAKLRQASEASEAQAKKDKTALLEAAVAEAMKSTVYGHISAVAREAGIASQYLRTLVEDKDPGWLDRAAEEREAVKAQRASRPRGGKARGQRAA